jgi:hypothetical protein
LWVPFPQNPYPLRRGVTGCAKRIALPTLPNGNTVNTEQTIDDPWSVRLNLPASWGKTICLSDLTPNQLRAYVIADNRLAEKAGWDESRLMIELQHLLTLEGPARRNCHRFDMPEIDFMLQGDEWKRDPDDCIEDHFRGSPVSRLGDLWISPIIHFAARRSDPPGA